MDDYRQTVGLVSAAMVAPCLLADCGFKGVLWQAKRDLVLVPNYARHYCFINLDHYEA